MRQIPLGRGKVALVDDEDYDKVAEYSWHCGQGYARTCLYLGGGAKNQKRYSLGMHRLIMDAKPGQMVDHIDGDFLNNQKSNLRFCTHSQNQANSRRRGKFSSRYKGVSRCHGKWVAVLCRERLGRFATEEEAARAYAEAAKKRYGEYAYHDPLEVA